MILKINTFINFGQPIHFEYFVLEKEIRKNMYRIYEGPLNLDFIDNLGFIDNLDFIDCPLKPTVNKRSRFY